MSELKRIDISYLTDDEVIEFYELFFGKILIKKKDFSYHDSLIRCLSRPNFTDGFLENLTPLEQTILKVLSVRITYPAAFLVEKLTLLTGQAPAVVGRSLNGLIEKKYIFVRNEDTYVVPDIYYPDEQKKLNFETVDNEPDSVYNTRFILDIQTILMYYISVNLKVSNAYGVYKKDVEQIKRVFDTFSEIKDAEFHYLSYFYSFYFLNDLSEIDLERIKGYFNEGPFGQCLILVKYLFPWFFALRNHFISRGKTAKISRKVFTELAHYSFLTTPYHCTPCKMTFDEALAFLEKLNVIKVSDQHVVIPGLKENEERNGDHNKINLSSNFNFYINADAVVGDIYMLPLCFDLLKYNTIVEYEITEYSVKRSIACGITYEDFERFIAGLNIQVAGNVQSTIKLWYEKYGTYYFAKGTIFFSHTPEKGILISSLIKKGLIYAYEIKKQEVFLIPPESEKKFFDFFKTNDMYFFEKKIVDSCDEIGISQIDLDPVTDAEK